MRNLGVYIQVPFCQTKCTYCNFHTGVVSSDRFAPYTQAVCQEIRKHRELLRTAGVHWTKGFDWETLKEKWVTHDVADTVYIGGGTPSLLRPDLLSGMIGALRETFTCEFEEVTLEADPETIEVEKAVHWLGAGINRISFGTQSFVDEELKAAGRMHRRADIYRSVKVLREVGLRNISFDLIAGLPKQTSESWRQSLDELVALSPEHVSIYMMEIDEESRLGLEVLREGPRYSARELPSEDAMVEFYETAQAVLSCAGYGQYEISNWAKAGFESRHNLKYWRREPYLGFGAGAHSFSGTQRWANRHDAASYVSAIAGGQVAEEGVERVTREAALEEELFLGLRQVAGIDLGRIERDYGITLQEKVESLRPAGMLEREGDVVRIPAGKMSVSNEIIVELLRDVIPRQASQATERRGEDELHGGKGQSVGRS
ncbi:MAG TPA: radical SAM family heme chaperone HemW [Candidatus Acidoferrum sp.]|jgi:oxygen-independent coproporphyrinogen-3 oxidase